jgi:hypothetical protein
MKLKILNFAFKCIKTVSVGQCNAQRQCCVGTQLHITYRIVRNTYLHSLGREQNFVMEISLALPRLLEAFLELVPILKRNNLLRNFLFTVFL